MENNFTWGVLFDLDGVLIDSEREYTAIWERINREFPTDVPNFAEKIKGTTLDNILSLHYPDPEIRKRVERRLYEEEDKMVYEFCPGARELLDNLKANGIPMALYTSSNGLKMDHLYRDIPELPGYFNTIVTGDQVAHSKPDPEGYLIAAKLLGLDEGRWVVIEDALQGAKAGKRSGGKVIGVAGTLSAETLAPYSDMVVDSLKKLDKETLRNLFDGTNEIRP